MSKASSVRPVHVEVVPIGNNDIESHGAHVPHAIEVREPYRPQTISALIGTSTSVVIPAQRVAGSLTEREKILLEGYRISRLIRYPLT
jgi:hypothetical protein